MSIQKNLIKSPSRAILEFHSPDGLEGFSNDSQPRYFPQSYPEKIEAFFRSDSTHKKYFKKVSAAIAKATSIVSYVSESHMRDYESHKTSKNLHFSQYGGCAWSTEYARKTIDSDSGKNAYLMRVLSTELNVIEQVSEKVVGCKELGIKGECRKWKLTNPDEGFYVGRPKKEYIAPYVKIDNRIEKEKALTKARRENLRISASTKRYELQLNDVGIKDCAVLKHYITLIKNAFKDARPLVSYYESKGIKKEDVFDHDLLFHILNDFNDDRYHVESETMYLEPHGLFAYLVHSIEEITNHEKPHFCYRIEGSRVYTGTSNFKRELRPLLQIKGKSLVEADLGNSQPLLAVILIEEWCQNNLGTIPADVLEYRKACEECSFYEYFMQQFPDRASNRSQFKAWFFASVFFCEVQPPEKQSKAAKEFQRKYPNCYTAICDIKGGVGSENFKDFAVKLQQVEAKLMFDEVTLYLIEKGVPALNGFDSILCYPENLEEVKARIKHVFSKRNLNPTIKCDTSTAFKPIDTLVNEMIRNEILGFQGKQGRQDSEQVFRNYRLRFGKYKGRLLISLTSPDELAWCNWFVQELRKNKSAKQLQSNHKYCALKWWADNHCNYSDNK